MKPLLLLIAFLGLLCFEDYSQTISAEGTYSLALKEDGSIVAWGNINEYTEFSRWSWQTGVVAISAGEWHSLALKEDGSVVALGRNNQGQLNVPSGLTGVVAISAGELHSLAVIPS